MSNGAGQFGYRPTPGVRAPVLPEVGDHVRFKQGRHRGRHGVVVGLPDFPLVGGDRITVPLIRFPRGKSAYALIDEIEPFDLALAPADTMGVDRAAP